MPARRTRRGADDNLGESIDQLEALVDAAARSVTEGTSAPASQSAAPDEPDVPLLTERVFPIDPDRIHFETDAGAGTSRTQPEAATGLSAGAAPRPAAASPLADHVRALVDSALRETVDELKSSILAEVRRALHPNAAADASPAAALTDDTHGQSQETETAARPRPMASTLSTTYTPQHTERDCYARWEAAGYFAPRGSAAAYCIALPPPNVTGSLHMGHAFQDTIMDALIRYHRMRGRQTLWQCGTDHAGIATQLVVERNLEAEGSSRVLLGREQFEAAVWAWKDKSSSTITQQLRRLGASVDWTRERFTLDAGLSRAVAEVFVRLYDEGLIYRGERLVNWDPVFHTAISDLEVVTEEEQGHLWHIRYPLADGPVDGTSALVVATTRPETMLGDTAVAVHPQDDRYRHLIGRQVRLPLTERTITVIGDEYVDPQFGSGCLKVTPAHDFNDYDIGMRHHLPMINIFAHDATLNDNAPAAYRGLDRFEARRRVVEDLEQQGLLARIDDHKLMVPRGDRSNAVIEPLLTDQWYVRVEPLAAPAITAVEEGRVRFVPENWDKTYFEWMRNVKDWCISRQLWWGHRIPAWYDADGEVYVGLDEADARRRAGLSDAVPLEQDEDVLDTWFSSALWPFSTLGWPEATAELKTFYPTSVLVTGFDIIFFWVARMIMMGMKFAGDVPFREVYVTGLILDGDGNKMSKSKGNIIDPMDVIDGIALDVLVAKRTANLMRPEDAPHIDAATRRQFPEGIPANGTDALRFSFAAMATHGREIRFDLGRIRGDRNFCNKLWNAARFVLMMTEAHADDLQSAERETGLADSWISTRLTATTSAVHEALALYRFDLAAQALYEFVWSDFCDWYLELAKVDLNDTARSDSQRRGTRATLIETLETTLRLIHPIMPFITEEIWQRVAPVAGISGETIMLQPYPEAATADPAADRAFTWLQEAVLGVRRIRAENNIEPQRSLPLLVAGGSDDEHAWLEANARYIKALGRIESIETVAEDEAPEAASALAGNMTILIPFAAQLDRDVALNRLDKDIDKRTQELGRVAAKLANEQFTSKAPAAIVEKERARHDELVAEIERLTAQRERIARD